MKLAMIWIFAGFFALYSLVLTLRLSFTAGTLVLWVITAALAGYGVFHRRIDAFCSAGVGRVVKILFFTGVALYTLLLVFVAVSGYTHTAGGDEDVIIVLGAGLRGEEVTEVLARRLQAALEAWRQNPDAVLVVTGGQGPNELIPEGLAMQRWLVARGVPETQILVEDKSTSTLENLRFARELLEARGFTADSKIAVVTNAFHMYRARRYAGMVGFTQVSAVPASINLLAILPSYTREVLAVIDLWLFKGAVGARFEGL